MKLGFWFIYFLLGVVSALLMYLVRNKEKDAGLATEIQYAIFILFGPIPLILALIGMGYRAIAMSRLKAFASITIIHFARHSTTRVFLNEIMVVDDLPQDYLRLLVPYIKAYQNLTYYATSGEPVTNLTQLAREEIDHDSIR